MHPKDSFTYKGKQSPCYLTWNQGGRIRYTIKYTLPTMVNSSLNLL